MNPTRVLVTSGVAAMMLALSSNAYAQNNTVGNGTPSQSLPPSRSDHDPQPQVASPTLPPEGVVQQAGVGGTTGYGRAGVLEVGGSAGLTFAGDLLALRIAPSIGWFFMNNIELSAIVGLNYARTQSNGNTTHATSLNILVEPSIHIPVSRTFFIFGGLGLGLAYADGPGAGFALAPRLGVNVMVGRSGVFTPAATFIYSTSGAVETPQGTLLTASTSLGINLGYTVMW
jgi:hypothetical protein